MGVAIIFAIAQILHERGGRIAQRHRHLERAELLHIRVRFLERGVDGVALRRTGEIDDGIGEREFALRAAEAVVGGPGVDGELQAARVGQTDVLHRHAHDAPREIARITTTVDHTAEPVERGIRVGAAHAFVKRRHLVVELLAALVEAATRAARDLGGLRHADASLDRKVGRDLEHVERTTTIAIGRAGEQVERRFVDLDIRPAWPAPTQASLRVGERATHDLGGVGGLQCAQHIHPRPRQQCAHHLEGRVLGGRTDEHQRAVLDVRQEGVLLGFVEAVHLVEEQHRAPTGRGPLGLRLFDRGAYVFDARHHRRQGDELRVRPLCDKAREGGLSGPGRPPQHHRVQAAGLERDAQRFAGPEHLRLTDDVGDAARSHPVRERTIGERAFRRGGRCAAPRLH